MPSLSLPLAISLLLALVCAVIPPPECDDVLIEHCLQKLEPRIAACDNETRCECTLVISEAASCYAACPQSNVTEYIRTYRDGKCATFDPHMFRRDADVDSALRANGVEPPHQRGGVRQELHPADLAARAAGDAHARTMELDWRYATYPAHPQDAVPFRTHGGHAALTAAGFQPLTGAWVGYGTPVLVYDYQQGVYTFVHQKRPAQTLQAATAAPEARPAPDGTASSGSTVTYDARANISATGNTSTATPLDYSRAAYTGPRSALSLTALAASISAPPGYRTAPADASRVGGTYSRAPYSIPPIAMLTAPAAATTTTTSLSPQEHAEILSKQAYKSYLKQIRKERAEQSERARQAALTASASAVASSQPGSVAASVVASAAQTTASPSMAAAAGQHSAQSRAHSPIAVSAARRLAPSWMLLLAVLACT